MLAKGTKLYFNKYWIDIVNFYLPYMEWLKEIDT